MPGGDLHGAVVIWFAITLQNQAGALDPWQRFLQTTGLAKYDHYSTTASRASTYTEAIRQFVENPIFGNGLDPTSTIADGIFAAHDLFIAAAFEGGVVLLIGILAAAYRPLRGLRLLELRRDPLTGLVTALVATELVFALTTPSLYNRYLWIPVALAITARGVPRPGVPARGDQARM